MLKVTALALFAAFLGAEARDSPNDDFDQP